MLPKQLALIFFFVGLCFLAKAQELSPYSQYGLGDLRGSGFTAQTSMGRVSSGYRDPVHINFANPASYSELQLTTLEGGMGLSSKKLETSTTSSRATAGLVDFLALAFPVRKGMAISAGLVPYSTVKYNFEQLDTLSDNTAYKRAFNGSGIIYQLYAGTGVRFPLKNDTAKHTVSIGANAIYLFGRDRYVEFLDFSGNANYFGTRKNTILRTSDIAMNSGIQYTLRLPKKWQFTIGADAFLPFSVNTIYSDVWDRFQVSSSGVFVFDTTFNSGEQNINRNFPVEYGGGFMLKKGSNLLLAADVHFRQWNAFKDIINPSIVFQNTTRFNAGIELKPGIGKGKSNFFKRNHYRLGGHYETAAFNLNGKGISQYGITFGLGIAVKGSFSVVNLGWEIGQRGTTENNMVKETFVRTYIGFTLNDKWFIKRKYD
jgi:hypothetical protein